MFSLKLNIYLLVVLAVLVFLGTIRAQSGDDTSGSDSSGSFSGSDPMSGDMSGSSTGDFGSSGDTSS
ncbi:hypothetical protein SAMD00019534_063250 [Acytostelium subglobosum LB1]|uniref:hypothetical protein n=1 Tax=Acytostelium subglobosum LB1 TaxID=1410327 RepID=UPI000644B544|nr:hypothetical protein SAMD00019534_063250 [Acytostelium subglobosum LB1]GAM23150.1 hypothetical protein SAMD00019534_063250 [Acytostelium subglobosum LB1]|eukprot:XP_012753599.1 hypothetical protein SAMD00019534_063250 [Acytostelium subglobosum LB1]